MRARAAALAAVALALAACGAKDEPSGRRHGSETRREGGRLARGARRARA